MSNIAAIALDQPSYMSVGAARRRHRIPFYTVTTRAWNLPSPQTLSGEDVLPGFVLDLAEIW